MEIKDSKQYKMFKKKISKSLPLLQKFIVFSIFKVSVLLKIKNTFPRNQMKIINNKSYRERFIRIRLKKNFYHSKKERYKMKR